MGGFYWFMLGLGIGYLIRQLENVADSIRKEKEK